MAVAGHGAGRSRHRRALVTACFMVATCPLSSTTANLLQQLAPNEYHSATAASAELDSGSSTTRAGGANSVDQTMTQTRPQGSNNSALLYRLGHLSDMSLHRPRLTRGDGLRGCAFGGRENSAYCRTFGRSASNEKIPSTNATLLDAAVRIPVGAVESLRSSYRSFADRLKGVGGGGSSGGGSGSGSGSGSGGGSGGGGDSGGRGRRSSRGGVGSAGGR